MNKIEGTVKGEPSPPHLVVITGTQCRAEKGLEARRLSAIGMTCLAGLAIASACLAAWIAVDPESARKALELGRAMLSAMRTGSCYYWFVAIAMAGSALSLVAARHRTTGRALRFSPGRMAMSKRFWQRPASTAAAPWSVPVSALSVTILVLTFPGHGSPVHWVMWGYAVIGAALAIGYRRTANPGTGA